MSAFRNLNVNTTGLNPISSMEELKEEVARLRGRTLPRTQRLASYFLVCYERWQLRRRELMWEGLAGLVGKCILTGRSRKATRLIAAIISSSLAISVFCMLERLYKRKASLSRMCRATLKVTLQAFIERLAYLFRKSARKEITPTRQALRDCGFPKGLATLIDEFANGKTWEEQEYECHLEKKRMTQEEMEERRRLDPWFDHTGISWF